MIRFLTVLAICVVTTLTTAAMAQPPSEQNSVFLKQFPDWYKPMPPFRIIGNVYHVGSQGLSMYFIPTDDGHIVIDGGLPGQAGMIAENIRMLGFEPADVKILLNTHAHFDHSGGLAELKELTGADLFASEGDRSALEGGFYLGFEDNPIFSAPPVAVDRTIKDRDEISLGNVTLTARLTPGHTRGCTSWWLDVEDGDEIFRTLIFCSASVAANRLISPPQYEGIVEDYKTTLDTMSGWTPDIFLANHPSFFHLSRKREEQIAGNERAFVDSDEFTVFATNARIAFYRSLENQTKAAIPEGE